MEKKKRKLFQYSPTKIQSALKAIRDDHMKVNTACKLYQVPRTTIRHKLDGTAPDDSYGSVGRRPWLGGIEQELVEWVIDIARRGAPISKTDLLTSISILCNERNIENPFVEGRMPTMAHREKEPSSSIGVPGDKWYTLFMRRHPTISLRKAEYLSKSRAAVDEDYIRLWFADVRNLLGADVDIFNDPHRIFNADETAIYVCPEGGLVLGERGKSTYNVGARGKENLTVMICGNANGDLAPSCAVFPYERTPTKVKDHKPPEWHYAKSKKGWMTGEIFLEYTKECFHPWLVKNNVKLPVILVLDGHVSHLTLSLSKFCRENGIIIVILPPNTTHLLQPLDVAFFYPLKCGWRLILKDWKRKQKFTVDVQIHHIPRILYELLKDGTFKVDLCRGFQACALIPFNVEKFPFHKLVKKWTPPSGPTVPVEDYSASSSLSHLEFLETQIPRTIVSEFVKKYTTDSTGLWQGIEYYGGLYEIWRNFKKHEERNSAHSPIANSINCLTQSAVQYSVLESNEGESEDLGGSIAPYTFDVAQVVSTLHCGETNVGPGEASSNGDSVTFIVEGIEPPDNAGRGEASSTGDSVTFVVETIEPSENLFMHSSGNNCEATEVESPVHIREKENEISSADVTFNHFTQIESPIHIGGKEESMTGTDVTLIRSTPSAEVHDQVRNPLTIRNRFDDARKSVRQILDGHFSPTDQTPTKSIRRTIRKKKFIPVITDISWVKQKEDILARKAQEAADIAERKSARAAAASEKKKIVEEKRKIAAEKKEQRLLQAAEKRRMQQEKAALKMAKKEKVTLTEEVSPLRDDNDDSSLIYEDIGLQDVVTLYNEDE